MDLKMALAVLTEAMSVTDDPEALREGVAITTAICLYYIADGVQSIATILADNIERLGPRPV